MNSEESQRRIARLYAERNGLYKTLPKVRLALNIGCGSGSFPRSYGHQECLIVNVDKGESVAGYPAYGFRNKGFDGFAKMASGNCINLKEDVFDVLPLLPPGVFDMIVCGQFIEHFPMRDLEVLLHECRRVLKSDGLLQIDTVTSKLEESTEGHAQAFTLETLDELLVRMLFRVSGSFEFAEGTALWVLATPDP